VTMRPRVLQLVESFREGGSERQAAELVRLLAEGGRYRLHVACLNATGPYRDAVERLGLGAIEHYPLTSFYDRNAAVQLARLVAYLRRQRIEVVHTHDFYTNVFGLAAAALARVPVRVGSRRETTGTRTGAQKRVERIAFRLASVVVANAEMVRRTLVDEGLPEPKTVTVYNGIDPSRVATAVSREEALAALGLPRDRGTRFVTIVANLRLAVKDHPTFLRAARRVVAAHPSAVFVVAGDGPLLAETRAFASGLGLGRAVRFLGACDRVADLLAVSDVCVLSSRAEGFSNAILEYMAAGRPVVATEVGGAREAIAEGETGYVVAPGDDRAMADRIATLLASRELACAMGERGRELVRERFGCDAQRARVEGLYDRLLAARRRGALVGAAASQPS
jgi:L-malate glycosyltransferase